MSSINTAVYGSVSSWIDAGTYDNSVSPENRVKYANFGDNRTDIEKAYTADILPLNTPWDKSLSYAALGDKMPLSNIMYYGSDKDSADPLKMELLNVDRRQITNYALGTSVGLPAYTHPVQGPDVIVLGGIDDYSASRPEYNRYTNGAVFSNSYSAWGVFSPFTQIPLKRAVLVPIVEAYKSDFSDSATFDLSEYLNNQKTEYSKIKRIYLDLYTDRDNNYNPDDGTGTVNRSIINYRLCAGVVLDTLSYGNGYVLNDIELDNIFKPIIGNAVAGALYGGSLAHNWTGVTTYCVPIANGFDLDFTKISNLTNDGQITSSSRFYCDADELTITQIRESVRKITAGFGMFFADNEYDAKHEPLDSNKIMLGILVDGVGNGDYTSGIDNREQTQWNLQDAHDIEYNPDNPPNILPPSVASTFNSVSLADGGLKRYVLDDNAMTAFSSDLWNVIDTSDPDALIENQTLTNFLTNNPLDCIVSVKRFALPDMSTSTTTNIHLGKVVMSAAGKPFDSTSTTLSCGSFEVPVFFGDFRDNLVKIMLTLPFCGTVNLDAASVIGKTIEVKYSIDYTTGTCTAWILQPTSDNGSYIVIDSACGNCTVDIPLSGVQTATLTGQLYNANEGLKSAKYNSIINGVNRAGKFVSAVSKRDFFGALNSAADVVDDLHDISVKDWNVEHTEIPFKVIGSSSGCNSMQLELTPRITCYVPVTDSTYNKSAYLHNVGAAVCTPAVIGDYNGYAEITNVELTSNATATEKNAIINALSSGVYL